MKRKITRMKEIIYKKFSKKEKEVRRNVKEERKEE